MSFEPGSPRPSFFAPRGRSLAAQENLDRSHDAGAAGGNNRQSASPSPSRTREAGPMTNVRARSVSAKPDCLKPRTASLTAVPSASRAEPADTAPASAGEPVQETVPKAPGPNLFDDAKKIMAWLAPLGMESIAVSIPPSADTANPLNLSQSLPMLKAVAKSTTMSPALAAHIESTQLHAPSETAPDAEKKAKKKAKQKAKEANDRFPGQAEQAVNVAKLLSSRFHPLMSTHYDSFPKEGTRLRDTYGNQKKVADEGKELTQLYFKGATAVREARLREWMTGFTEAGQAEEQAEEQAAGASATGRTNRPLPRKGGASKVVLPEWLRSFDGVQKLEARVIEQSERLSGLPEGDEKIKLTRNILEVTSSIILTKLSLAWLQCVDPDIIERMGNPVILGVAVTAQKEKYKKIMGSDALLNDAKREGWRRLDLIHGLLHYNSRLDREHQLSTWLRMHFATSAIPAMADLCAASGRSTEVTQGSQAQAIQTGMSAHISPVDQSLPWADRFIKDLELISDYVVTLRTALISLEGKAFKQDLSDAYKLLEKKVGEAQDGFEELLEGLVIRRDCAPEAEAEGARQESADVDLLVQELRQRIRSTRMLRDFALQACHDNPRCASPLAQEDDISPAERGTQNLASDLTVAAQTPHPAPSQTQPVGSLQTALEEPGPPAAPVGASSFLPPEPLPTDPSFERSSPIASPDLPPTSVDDLLEAAEDHFFTLGEKIEELPPLEWKISQVGMTPAQKASLEAAQKVAAGVILEINALASAANQGIVRHQDALASLAGGAGLAASVQRLAEADTLFETFAQQIQEISSLCELKRLPEEVRLENKAKLVQLNSGMKLAQEAYQRASLRVRAFEASPKSKVLSPKQIKELYNADPREIDIFGVEFVPDFKTKTAEMMEYGLLVEEPAGGGAERKGTNAAGGQIGDAAETTVEETKTPIWKLKLKVRDLEVNGAKNISFKTIVLHFHPDNKRHPNKDFRNADLQASDLVRSACHLKPNDHSVKRIQVPPDFAIWAWNEARKADAARQRQKWRAERPGPTKKPVLPALRRRR